jgi:hypothetical protein
MTAQTTGTYLWSIEEKGCLLACADLCVKRRTTTYAHYHAMFIDQGHVRGISGLTGQLSSLCKHYHYTKKDVSRKPAFLERGSGCSKLPQDLEAVRAAAYAALTAEEVSDVDANQREAQRADSEQHPVVSKSLDRCHKRLVWGD